MVAGLGWAMPAGIAAGYLADVVFADPRRGHPVAGFGWCASTLERFSYRDSRGSGVLHTVALVTGVAGAGALAQRRAAGGVPLALLAAAATWTALGGTSLAATGAAMADLLDGGDLDGARALLPSLCGRDPAALDGPGLARAACESVAENTADASVAPLLWAAVAGVPGVLAYRGINTLDAMIGHRSVRYLRFGWAAARSDDVVNYVPARVTGVLAALCAPRSAVPDPARSQHGPATPVGTPARTPGWPRPRSPAHWGCDWAARLSTATNWRSGPPWARVIPRCPGTCGVRFGCRGWCNLPPSASRCWSAPVFSAADRSGRPVCPRR